VYRFNFILYVFLDVGPRFLNMRRVNSKSVLSFACSWHGYAVLLKLSV
jgi:hypothetical protein